MRAVTNKIEKILFFEKKRSLRVFKESTEWVNLALVSKIIESRCLLFEHIQKDKNPRIRAAR